MLYDICNKGTMTDIRTSKEIKFRDAVFILSSNLVPQPKTIDDILEAFDNVKKGKNFFEIEIQNNPSRGSAQKKNGFFGFMNRFFKS